MPVSQEVVRQINTIKTYLVGQNKFYEESQLRNIYVALLTVEGAVMFGDEGELARLCVDFCHKKQREYTEKN